MLATPDLSPFIAEIDRLDEWLASHSEADNADLYASVRAMRAHLDHLIRKKGQIPAITQERMAKATEHMKIEFENERKETVRRG